MTDVEVRTESRGAPETSGYDVDVVQLSDLRLPGGTTSSIAEEIRVQSAAGITTALVHIAGSVTTYALPWSQHIRRVVGLPNVRLATPDEKVKAKLAVIRHPTVIESTRSSLEGIEADRVIIVANHAAIDAAGKQHYDIAATGRKVRELFGTEPIWAPIGPVVRSTMEQQTQAVPFRDDDWFNIFDVSDELRPRTGFLGDRPVLGRHSRPQPGKWPNRGRDILAAYPDSPDYQVRVLGGASVAQKHLGYVPENWEVIPFGGEEPMRFLSQIDFWVYMHHPSLREAFGRAAMEALAAGCVAIMPPYMRELFGEAALYAKPSEVRELVDEYAADEAKFLEQSRLAVEFACRFSSQMHLQRLEGLGVTAAGQPPGDAGAPSGDAGAPSGSAAGAAEAAVAGLTGEPGLLVIEGDHSQTAMRQYADLLAAAPSLTGAIVADAPSGVLPGERTVFIPSARRLNMESDLWAEYVQARLSSVISAVLPQRILYSGVLPSPGVLATLHGTPAQKTWLRQSPLDGVRQDCVRQDRVPSDADRPGGGAGEAAVDAERSFQKVLAGDSVSPAEHWFRPSKEGGA